AVVVQAGPDRWSAGEGVEHIVLADGLLFDKATNSLTGQPDPQWDATLGKTERLRRALPDRLRRLDAPGVIQPRAAMSREELLSRFIDQRARVLKYARETDVPLKAHTAANPFFGSLNAHQWLLYIPLHHLRHNQQIAEVKAGSQRRPPHGGADHRAHEGGSARPVGLGQGGEAPPLNAPRPSPPSTCGGMSS